MARIYNTNPAVRNDTDAYKLAERDWLVANSNGNLTAFGDVETIGGASCVHLRFKDSDLYIRITQWNSSNYAIKLSVHTRVNGTWSNELLYTGNSSLGSYGTTFTLEYAEIDNCLFRIGAFASGNTKTSLGIFCFSLHGTGYIGLRGLGYSTFIDVSNGYDSPVLYNTDEHTAYTSNMYSFSNSARSILAPSDAILCPVLPYIRTSDYEQGAIEWASNVNKNLYYVATATGSRVFESGANYLINGVSYKACANDLFMFL